MASLRVFISSTCFDLGPIRGQLRNFILGMGYEPIMSDYNDVLYDPRLHTHTSCIEEIATCDVIILIVGSRFGGKAIPEAIAKVDFEAVIDKSKSVEHLKSKENLSVTQLEILKAVEIEIPIFTFIDNRLWNDHELYEKNKGKPIISDIEFPSIQKPETAKFIFEFVNFLRHRTRGNSINSFGKFEDIEDTLKKQWSGLIQRLLNDIRRQKTETKRIDALSNQFEDLKTAILTSISNTNERQVARGVVRFRRLVDFLRNLRLPDYNIVLNENISWEQFLHGELDIVNIIDLTAMHPDSNRHFRPRTLLVKSDNTYYNVRFSQDYIIELGQEFEAFNQLPSETKNIIFDALADMRSSMMQIRYRTEDYREFLEQYQENHMGNISLFENENENTDT